MEDRIYFEFINLVCEGKLKSAKELVRDHPFLSEDLELRVKKKTGSISIPSDIAKLSEILEENITISSHNSFEPEILRFKLLDYKGDVNYLYNVLKKLENTEYSIQRRKDDD